MRTLLRRHGGLMVYTALNYLDKGLAVAVPLMVLWVSRDQILYNQVEYIYSIGALAVVALELGVRNYLLFGYREAPDQERFLADGHNHFLLLHLIYVVGSLLVVGSMAMARIASPALWLLITSRTLYNSLFAFYSIQARLLDRPSAVFVLSLGANAGTCLLLGGTWLLNRHQTLWLVFTTQAILVLALAGMAIHRRLWRQFRSTLAYLCRTIGYAWPIILNVFLVVAIQNVGKVYAQWALSPNEMTRLAMAQRFALIVQLGHTSAVGYLSKRFFMAEGFRMDRSLWANYAGALGLGIVFTFCAAAIAGRVLGNAVSPTDPVFLLMMIFTVVWCCSAFLEQYLNKVNKNLWIPLISLVGVLVFGLVAYLARAVGVIGIALAMAAYAVTSLLLTLTVLVRIRRSYLRA